MKDFRYKKPKENEQVITYIVDQENGIDGFAIGIYMDGKFFEGGLYTGEEYTLGVTHWTPLPKKPTSYNSGYMVRLAKAILSQIAKATSYIRKRCTQ